MDKRSRLENYEKRYYNEHEKRHKLDQRISFPLTLITLLFGSTTYLIPVVIENKLQNNLYGLVILLLLMIVCLLLAISYLIKAYIFPYFPKKLKYYEYIIIPLPRELEEYIKRIEECEEKISEEYIEFLISAYSNAIEKNVELNMKKETFFNKTNIWIIIALLFAVLIILSKNFRLLLELL